MNSRVIRRYQHFGRSLFLRAHGDRTFPSSVFPREVFPPSLTSARH
ncbi:protein phophatase 2c family protein [Moniliophthora roreri]|nr:protein phophatase 2c family protein [Moniliophthora roreri]